MTEGFCDYSDLPVAHCFHCRPVEPPPAPRVKPTGFRRGGGIPAQYEGRCPACGDDIEIGELITESDGTYIHKECST